MRRYYILAILLLIILFCVPTSVSAHPLDMSSTKLTFHDHTIEVEMLIHRNLLAQVGIDYPQQGEISPSLQQRTFALIQRGFSLTNDGKKMVPRLQSVEMENGVQVYVNMKYTSTRPLQRVEANYQLFFAQAERHQDVVSIVQGEKESSFLFTKSVRHFTIQTGAELSVWTTLREFIGMGMEHILTGYDHLAFLLALLVVSRTLKEVVKVVTAFTVAHSITLTLAALQIVVVPSY